MAASASAAMPMRMSAVVMRAITTQPAMPSSSSLANTYTSLAIRAPPPSRPRTASSAKATTMRHWKPLSGCKYLPTNTITSAVSVPCASAPTIASASGKLWSCSSTTDSVELLSCHKLKPISRARESKPPHTTGLAICTCRSRTSLSARSKTRSSSAMVTSKESFLPQGLEARATGKREGRPLVLEATESRHKRPTLLLEATERREGRKPSSRSLASESASDLCLTSAHARSSEMRACTKLREVDVIWEDEVERLSLLGESPPCRATSGVRDLTVPPPLRRGELSERALTDGESTWACSSSAASFTCSNSSPISEGSLS
mmetsp:Transcript_28308/g.71235  ORF Transcript_28308/g.71235 Transcript_28308/m.71235 type:complete len:319 (-) Transcript_28308:1375-2331(-)